MGRRERWGWGALRQRVAVMGADKEWWTLIWLQKLGLGRFQGVGWIVWPEGA